MDRKSGYRHYSGFVTDWTVEELVPFPAGATSVFLLYGVHTVPWSTQSPM